MLHQNLVFRPNARYQTITLFLFLIFLVYGSGVQSSQAGSNAVRTVCQSVSTPCDFMTIQAAINGSVAGDVLEFPVNKETYEETILINKSLTFVGQTTSINAASFSGATAVSISNNAIVIMQNFIIQNGSGSDGAGLSLNSGTLTLTNVSFSGNNATGDGGALFVGSSSSATFTDVTMQNNTAVDSGGAIFNDGTIEANNLTLTDNTATTGGGLYNSGTFTMDNESDMQRNIASQNGGGIYNEAGSNATIIASDMSKNEATDGAAVYNAGILQVTTTNIRNGNLANQRGGGLFNSNNGQVTLLNSAVVQNDGTTGAGIYNEGTLTATNSTISRNEGTNGAGLYNQSGIATLNNVTIHLTIGTSIFANGGTVNVGNTIISSAAAYTACGGSGNVISNGYNLATDESCTFLTALGDLQGLDPDLNGISSPAEGSAYHMPKLTSPVVNAGNPASVGSSSTACIVDDQRSMPRPQNMRCDIGAVEIEIFRLFVPSVSK